MFNERNDTSPLSTNDSVPGGAEVPLPLALISSNPRKSDQLRKYAGAGDRATTQPPLFNEDLIKEALSLTPENGMDYVAAIAREKLLMQRELARIQEGTDTDYAMIVSDSVVMLPKPNGEYFAVNRDGLNEAQKELIRKQLNELGEVTYVGAVAFGRKLGKSVFTILTYLKVPLAEPLQEFPFSVESIPKIVDANRGFEAGFISYEIQEENKFLHPAFRPIKFGVGDFEAVRPFISGLAPQVIELADKTAQFDQKIAPLLEWSISAHPFNTLSFYAEREKHPDGDLKRDYYTPLISEYGSFFAAYGGNCSLFTLDFIDELRRQGYDPHVVIYPANYNIDYEKGHSGLLVDVDNVRYLIDPGLTIPYPIPVSFHIPLYPIQIGSKLIVTELRDFNGDLIPDLVVSHKGKINVLLGQKLETPEEFREELPEILETLHALRTTLKIDLHDASGIKNLGITVNLKASTVTINEGGHLKVLSFSNLTSPESQSFIQRVFVDNGGSFNLSEQLNAVLGSL